LTTKTANIVILTGAGISAESGLGTFRDKDGLWTKYNLEDVATPEGFARNPELVLNFYNARRENCLNAEPNAAHFALARLEADHRGDVLIVTQNVDDLHERAGSKSVWHMHGQLNRALCANCSNRWDAPKVMDVSHPCPSCGVPAARPDVVWFGEMPYLMEDIETRLATADLFVSIGTSGSVYPAAGFALEAKTAGAECLELNLEPSDTPGSFDDSRFGPATKIVPQWVTEILAPK